MRVIRVLFKIILAHLSYLLVCLRQRAVAQGRGVLIIRLDALGDFVLFTDAAKAYRLLYPHQPITLLTAKPQDQLAKHLPFWDDVWVIDKNEFKRNMVYQYQWLLKIRRAGFAVIVQACYSRSMVEDSLVLASGAKERITMLGDGENIHPLEKSCGDRYYTTCIANPVDGLDEMHRNKHLIQTLGLTTFEAKVPVLPPLGSKPEGLPTRFYVIAPGAGQRYRQWPAQSFARLCTQVYEKTGLTGLVVGIEADYQIAEGIQQLTQAPLMNMAGKTTVLSLIELIRAAQFVVGNETAAIHIAPAVGVKSLVILGGGHYGRFVPYQVKGGDGVYTPQPIIHRMDCYQCSWQCPFIKSPQETVPCISRISVDDAFQALLNQGLLA